MWIKESGAEVVTSTDVSCLMHMEGYVRRHGIPLETKHIALILRGEDGTEG
jgi:L-lactate dehydrogenase complex protein LldE